MSASTPISLPPTDMTDTVRDLPISPDELPEGVPYTPSPETLARIAAYNQAMYATVLLAVIEGGPMAGGER